MTSQLETLVLNGLSLNDEVSFGLEELDMTPPVKRAEWAQGVDSDGADLIRTPLYDNRVVKVKVRVLKRSTMDLALAKTGELVDMLQEAEKYPGGIPLEWTPANATKKITFYVLTSSVNGLPVSVVSEPGWFVNMPVLSIAFTCLPFGYGEEESVTSAVANTTGLSVVTLTANGVKGDVPAEGRLVVKDTASVGRRYVEWGLEQRYYNAATSLVIDSEDLTPAAGEKSSTVTAGAYKRAGATTYTIATTLLPEPTTCLETGNLSHVGTFRVKARAQVVLGSESVAENVFARLSWQDGESPFRANEWAQLLGGNKFYEVDLGLITITSAEAGTQKWAGRLEAYSANKAATDTLHVDYITLIPVGEGYGKSRGTTAISAGNIIAFDAFTTGTLSGALGSRTATLGGKWTTSGAATDWTVESGLAVRETTADSELRYGKLGSAVGNGVASGVFEIKSPGIAAYIAGVLGRFKDSSNYVFAEGEIISQTKAKVRLGTKVAGSGTNLAEWVHDFGEHKIKLARFELTLMTLLDGSMTVTGNASVDGAIFPVSLAASSAAVASGGALESGSFAVCDYAAGVTVVTRRVFSLNVKAMAAPAYVIQSGRSMEITSDSTLTTDTSGTYYGPSPMYRGSRLYVPQAGKAKRTSRVLVKADRNDLEAADQQTIADAFTAQLFVTPRYSVIPR